MRVRTRWTLACAFLGVAVAADALRPAPAQWTAGAAMKGIEVYQQFLSPLLPRLGINCRFVPTCSVYAEAVIRRDGIAPGSWRALKRVAQCNPWMTAVGTVDPP